MDSGQGKVQKNFGWDFSIGGSEATGTVRSVGVPAQYRDKKTNISQYQRDSKKASSDSGYLSSSSYKSALNGPPETSLEDVTGFFSKYIYSYSIVFVKKVTMISSLLLM